MSTNYKSARDDEFFTCDDCGRSFPKGWSNEEQDAEAKVNGFDVFDLDDLCVVCDDCYKRAMAQIS